MIIKLQANRLVIDGETMEKDHTKKAIAQHLKMMLFGIHAKPNG